MSFKNVEFYSLVAYERTQKNQQWKGLTFNLNTSISFSRFLISHQVLFTKFVLSLKLKITIKTKHILSCFCFTVLYWEMEFLKYDSVS